MAEYKCGTCMFRAEDGTCRGVMPQRGLTGASQTGHDGTGPSSLAIAYHYGAQGPWPPVAESAWCSAWLPTGQRDLWHETRAADVARQLLAMREGK